MANNRMYIVHIPTGYAVCFGKRMGWGWYLGAGSNTNAALEELYEKLEAIGYGEEGRQDDFGIALENARAISGGMYVFLR